jgi:hypothetical protein
MALVSAALFGASTPFAKLPLSGGLDPWLLAGLLYLGSGLGLGLVHFVRRGVFGPVLLMLDRTGPRRLLPVKRRTKVTPDHVQD